MSLSRAGFLKLAPRVESLTVPGLDEPVTIGVMSAGERDAFEAEQARDPHRDFRARVLIAGVREPDGSPTFNRADVPVLNALPSDVVDPIVEAILKLNKLRESDAEDVRKNSGSGPGSDSAAA